MSVKNSNISHSAGDVSATAVVGAFDQTVKPAGFSDYVNKHATASDNKLVNGKRCTLRDLDYKNVALLQSCLSELGHILPRHKIGWGIKQHRKFVREVKKARQLGLLPFSLY
ncbi:MAG: 30S ribosomal protein S18 [Candidatus Hodgkinia cicadicola]